MNRNLNLLAFALGLLAVIWVAIGYIGGSHIALVVSCLIAVVYLAGASEMRRFHLNTAALDSALRNIPDDLAHLGEWLQQVPAALQNTVRLRIEGERAALPGPGLTPYLVGLLVLLGMLGTFLGMVVTLNGAVLALESTTDLQTIRAALAAPVKGLGVAFGTSVAGVATSAMLGLISALCRRERLRVGQLLDSRIAGVLRNFSLAHQRQETFKALQQQSQALPTLVDKIDALMNHMSEQNRQLGEQLLAGQQNFHAEAKALYAGLAASVDQSLKASLKESAVKAAEAIQPVVTATMAGIAGETRGLQEQLFDTVRSQLDGMAGRFGETVGTVSSTWTQALAAHEQANESQRLQLAKTLDAYADTFAQGSQTLLASLRDSDANLKDALTAAHGEFAQTAQTRQAALAEHVTQQLAGTAARLEGAVATVNQTWSTALGKHEAASERLTQALADTQSSLADTFARRSADLLAELRAQQTAWQGEWATGESQRQAALQESMAAMAQRLESHWQQTGAATQAQQAQMAESLDDMARRFVSETQRQSETTIAEVTRLIETAAEAPKAAAEVIRELRQELSASMAHDNGLLEERSRMMETLSTLLDAINHASTEQRRAIDALVQSSATMLERVGSEFAGKVQGETGKLVEIGTSLSVGTIEVASLGEAFGHAVKLFSDSNDKMMTTLQRIEGALAKSLTRSDEQLAYYVAQAREIIDLSIMSQKQIVDELHRAAGQTLAASEA